MNIQLQGQFTELEMRLIAAHLKHELDLTKYTTNTGRKCLTIKCVECNVLVIDTTQKQN